LLDGGWLVVQAKSEARPLLERLVPAGELGPVKFVIVVSEDVDLADDVSVMWGIFTRFDPARDLVAQSQTFIGARPVYRGRIGIDASWKPGYPVPVEMPPEIVTLVDRRWKEYMTP
jgi:4-hydroxy-3-polyprenylbenzoate decarboxylase